MRSTDNKSVRSDHDQTTTNLDDTTMKTIRVWTNETRDEYAVSFRGDAVMRAETLSGILYPKLIGIIPSDPGISTPQEALDAWVDTKRMMK